MGCKVAKNERTPDQGDDASRCPRIISRTLRFGRAASGGALAPEPPHATGVGPEFDLYLLFFLALILASPFVTYLFHPC